MCGYQSETHWPLCPYCLNVRCVGISVLLLVPIAVITLPKDGGKGWPASRFSSGLGSNKSMWLGPPSMNSQMTDLALGGKCGGLGAIGFLPFTAAAYTICSQQMNRALTRRNQNRHLQGSPVVKLLVQECGFVSLFNAKTSELILIDELVRVQYRVAEIHQRSETSRFSACGTLRLQASAMLSLSRCGCESDPLCFSRKVSTVSVSQPSGFLEYAN